MSNDALVERVATILKVEKLRAIPGMDSAAVALNSRPTYHELQHVKKIIEIIDRERESANAG